MYNDSDLISHLESASAIKTQSFVYAEINMNDATNISLVGNYRNRPYDEETIATTFSEESKDTPEASRKYFGYTDSDTVVDGGLNDDGMPMAFVSQKEKNKMLYSLEDCFGKFRPRSGINKAVFLPGQWCHNVTSTMMSRPRYYISDKNDTFKYWTSFREQKVDNTPIEVVSILPIVVESVINLEAEDYVLQDQDLPYNATTNPYITTATVRSFYLKINLKSSHQLGVGTLVALSGLQQTGSEFGLSVYNGVYEITDINLNGGSNIVVKTDIDPELGVDDGGLSLEAVTTVSAGLVFISTKTESAFQGFSNVKVPNKNEFYINDVAPFVVYKQQVPANRIVVKMQTHVGTRGTIVGGVEVEDGLFENENEIVNRVVPITWKVQCLDSSGNWNTIKSFSDADNATTPLIPRDGYLELQYSNGTWEVGTQALEANTPLVTELTSPTNISGQMYKEFMLINGVRIVVDSISKLGRTFDLIELSPRLAVDMSDVTTDFTITKTASDLGQSGLPVGQLLASQGSISLTDFDGEFNSDYPLVLSNGTINAAGSVISKYIKKGAQFKFYEVVKDVLVGESAINDVYVPLKTLYAESMPELSFSDKKASISLRDAYYYFEDLQAPRLLLEDVSLSYAIATILDSVGFTNYVYKRSPNDPDPIIRHFFVAPKTSVANVLQDIAVSTQTAMFFDEYNNLVLMSKGYMMPSIGANDRPTEYDTILIGNSDIAADAGKQPNIMDITKNENTIFNDGTVKFTERYIKKQVSQVSPAPLTSEGGVPQQRLVLPNEQKWVYASVLLWEPSPSENVRPSNSDSNNTQSGEVLAAIPLKTTLTSNVPTVVNGQVIDNKIELGEAVYWLPRYSGYFHANGEIIKYDAVEYSVDGVGNVWLTDSKDYVEYFSQLVYGGKIYPTGNVRIFAEPKYSKNQDGDVVLVDGDVARHGRGQFGTAIVEHKAGIASDHWTQVNTTGIEMRSQLLFADKYRTEVTIKKVNASNGSKYVKVPTSYEKYLRQGQIVTGTGIKSNSKISNIYLSTNKFKMTKETKASISSGTLTLAGDPATNKGYVYDSSLVHSAFGVAGTSNTALAKKSSRTSIIKNYMSSAPGSESGNSSTLSSSTLQSSALVFTGPDFSGTGISPMDYISCTYRSFTSSMASSTYKHFGTRMRIIGTDAADPTLSTVAGAETVFPQTKLKGSSGGIAIMADPSRNTGYFLELIALTDENMSAYSSASANTEDLSESIFNVVLYKTQKQTNGLSTNEKNIVNNVTAVKLVDKSAEKKLVKYYVSNTVSVGEEISITGTSWNTSGVKVQSRDDNSITVKYSGSKSFGSTANGSYLQKNITAGKMTVRAKAIPVKLWTGMAEILTDNGMFTGQQRLTGQEKPTVYDLALEYRELSNGDLRFYIYLNNNLIGTVRDTDPIPKNKRQNKMGLFVRGSSRVMFENVYAIGSNVSNNYRNSTYAPFTDTMNFNMETDSDAAFDKYSLPKPVKTTYFSGISPIAPPSTDMYYEEFGTIMREAKHYNITFDRAYPAFRSLIAPTFNPIKGYAVSGYVATPYGAEFLVFNTMDSALVFGDNQNPLNILGITFTNQADYNYTMDDYLSKMSDYSNYDMLTIGGNQDTAFNPSLTKKTYQNIKSSRMTYGKKEFIIDGTYIQTRADAEHIMQWMIDKMATPRKSVGLKVFGMPHLQLGDVVKIHHKDIDGYFVNPDSLFVVYDIEYSGSGSGPENTVYLSEVDTNG